MVERWTMSKELAELFFSYFGGHRDLCCPAVEGLRERHHPKRLSFFCEGIWEGDREYALSGWFSDLGNFLIFGTWQKQDS